MQVQWGHRNAGLAQGQSVFFLNTWGIDRSMCSSAGSPMQEVGAIAGRATFPKLQDRLSSRPCAVPWTMDEPAFVVKDWCTPWLRNRFTLEGLTNLAHSPDGELAQVQLRVLLRVPWTQIKLTVWCCPLDVG